MKHLSKTLLSTASALLLLAGAAKAEAPSSFYHLDDRGELVSAVSQPDPARWIICHSRSLSTENSDVQKLKVMMRAAHQAELKSGNGVSGLVWVSCDPDDSLMLQGLRDDPVPFLIVPKSAKAGHPFAQVGEVTEIPAVVVAGQDLSPIQSLNGLKAIEAVFGLDEPPPPVSCIFEPDLSLAAWLNSGNNYDGHTFVTNALAWAWGVEAGIPALGFCHPSQFPAQLAQDSDVRWGTSLLAGWVQRQNNLFNITHIQNARHDREKLIGDLAAKSGNAAGASPQSALPKNEFAQKRAEDALVSDFDQFAASQKFPSSNRFRSALFLRLKDYDFQSGCFPCELESRVFVINELRYIRQAHELFARPTHPFEIGNLPAGPLFAAAWPQPSTPFEGDLLRGLPTLMAGNPVVAVPPSQAEELVAGHADSNRVALVYVEGEVAFDQNGSPKFTIHEGRIGGWVAFGGKGRNPVPVGLDTAAGVNGVAVTWKN